MSPSPDQGTQKVSVNTIHKPETRGTIFLRQLITERIILYYNFFETQVSLKAFRSPLVRSNNMKYSGLNPWKWSTNACVVSKLWQSRCRPCLLKTYLFWPCACIPLMFVMSVNHRWWLLSRSIFSTLVIVISIFQLLKIRPFQPIYFGAVFMSRGGFHSTVVRQHFVKFLGPTWPYGKRKSYFCYQSLACFQ
jgi:hypothetical protein